MATVVVHHLESARSQRVLGLLEELGVPYEVKRTARNPETMLAASHPKLTASLATIHARPVCQRAVAKGGPYELMR